MYLQTLGSLRLIGTAQGFAFKELLLLTYLALETSQSRKTLNRLFYPGKADANLRGVLAKLTDAGLIEKDRAGAYFAGGCTVDALELTAAFDQNNFEQVGELYRDERDGFVLDVEASYSPELQDWLAQKRLELGNRAFEAKLELLELAYSQGHNSQVSQLVQQAASLLLSGQAEGTALGCGVCCNGCPRTPSSPLESNCSSGAGTALGWISRSHSKIWQRHSSGAISKPAICWIFADGVARCASCWMHWPNPTWLLLRWWGQVGTAKVRWANGPPWNTCGALDDLRGPCL